RDQGARSVRRGRRHGRARRAGPSVVSRAGGALHRDRQTGAGAAATRTIYADRYALRRNAQPSRLDNPPPSRPQTFGLGARFRGGNRRCIKRSPQAAPRPRAHGRGAGTGSPRARRCLRRFRMESCRRGRAHAVSATVNSPADAVLHALPHPVITVSPDGKIADANVAAEQFFEASIPVLRRHMLRDLVPFGSPLLTLVEQVRARDAGSMSTRWIWRPHAIRASVWSIFMSGRWRNTPTTSS